MIRWSVVICVTLVLLAAPSKVHGQMKTDILETCTAEEGYLAKCGPGANCFIIDGYPTCHCVVDVATGIPLAGNPYKACTWDVTGTWQLYSFFAKKSGFYQEIISPISNEPFVIRLDRTDAILKTRYITGAIFVITALTSFALGVCSRAFLDVHDNTTIIFEQAEGFLSGDGRGAILRTALLDSSLRKMFPLSKKPKDRWDMWGKWQKSDGAEVKIMKLKKPHNWPSFFHRKWKYWAAYWYNDDSFAAPLLRLSTAIFLDKTLKSEQVNFMTDARFIQLGWYGGLQFGSQRINIYSPADGKELFTLLKVDSLPPYTSFTSAANLAGSFNQQSITYTGPASSVTSTAQQEATEGTSDAGSRSNRGVEIIERLPDAPAPRTIGGTQSTARRQIVSDMISQAQASRSQRSLLPQSDSQSSGSDFPVGFVTDPHSVEECNSLIGAFDEHQTNEDDGSQFNPSAPSGQGSGQSEGTRIVRMGNSIANPPDDNWEQQRRLGPFRDVAQLDPYVPTATQLAGQTWYHEIESRYQAALLYEKQQLESMGWGIF